MDLNINGELHNRFKDMYYFELELRDKIESSMSIRIGILGVFIGGLTYITNNLPPITTSIISSLFYLFYILIIISVVLTTYFILRTLLPQKYGYLPEPASIKQYFDELKDYYDTQDVIEDNLQLNQKLITDYYDFFIQKYSENAQINSNNNMKKSGYRANTTLLLFTVGAFLMFTVILLVIHRVIFLLSH